MCNTWTRPGGGRLLAGGLGTSLASDIRSKLGVKEGYGGGNIVGLVGGGTYVASLGQYVLT